MTVLQPSFEVCFLFEIRAQDAYDLLQVRLALFNRRDFSAQMVSNVTLQNFNHEAIHRATYRRDLLQDGETFSLDF